MFRNEDDLVRGFNSLALACLETDSKLLADAELTTHMHFAVQTENPADVARVFRYKYSRYFNRKYHRSSSLGDPDVFFLELDGIRHILTGLSYVMRQGLHHGLTSTPFGYPYCSSNALFRTDLGKYAGEKIMVKEKQYKYLPARTKLPDTYRMNDSGLIIREDVIDCKYVEDLYMTPRNFLYYMNRLSDSKWENDQKEDETDMPAITLNLIENKMPESRLEDLLVFEKGRGGKTGMTDLELCREIDDGYLKTFSGGDASKTIYDLSGDERITLSNRIWNDLRFSSGRFNGRTYRPITKNQLLRCMVLASVGQTENN